MLIYPNIDPIALQLGPLAIRWYSLAYIAGILGGWWYAGKMNDRAQYINQKQFDSILSWIVVGIILGGRLGYVIFYNAPYFLAHPIEIFYLWQGGMSFHGGMIGMVTAIYIFCRRNQIQFFRVMDVAACVSPIGLGFGRLANFINGELYGRAGYSVFSMMFPTEVLSENKDSLNRTYQVIASVNAKDPTLLSKAITTTDSQSALYKLFNAHNQIVVDAFNKYYPLRHPSQLYEAVMEGALFVIILSILFWVFNKWHRPGFLSGTFLFCYGVFRIIAECFREPDVQLGYFFQYVTMGQILCVPMLLLGMILIIWSQSRKPQEHIQR